MEYLDESQIFVFLIQLLVLLGLARGLGELFNRFGQPAITAEILVGVLLGPTLLGRLWPQGFAFLFPPEPAQWNMLDTVAWFGILFFLLKIGIEMDMSSAWRQRGDARRCFWDDLEDHLVYKRRADRGNVRRSAVIAGVSFQDDRSREFTAHELERSGADGLLQIPLRSDRFDVLLRHDLLTEQAGNKVGVYGAQVHADGILVNLLDAF